MFKNTIGCCDESLYYRTCDIFGTIGTVSTCWLQICQKILKNQKILLVKFLKNQKFSLFLAPVARRHGRLLGPLWADPAEISRGEQTRVWLLMIRISLRYAEVHRHSG